jgi:integrase
VECGVGVTHTFDRAFFEVHELDDLRDFTQRRFLSSSADESVLSMFSQDELEEFEGFVGSPTQYMRLTTIAKYLKWFANHMISRPSLADYNRIRSVETQIMSRRPSRKGRNKDEDRSLSDLQLEALFEVIRIGSEYNPFTPEIQRRNRLIVLLLYHLGIRGGELLNIKVSDIDFSKHQVKVLRRADEKDDPRVREPNVKTLERTLPISETLSRELHEYVTADRRKVPNAKRNSFLFVTHKLGPALGQPISKSGYHKVMAVVKAVSPTLSALAGHMLRHTWNRKFSEHMDSMDNPPSEERQEQIRSYLMGWKPGSGSAAHYNKRFRQEQANKAALALQESCGIRLPQDLRNDE